MNTLMIIIATIILFILGFLLGVSFPYAIRKYIELEKFSESIEKKEVSQPDNNELEELKKEISLINNKLSNTTINNAVILEEWLNGGGTDGS